MRVKPWMALALALALTAAWAPQAVAQDDPSRVSVTGGAGSEGSDVPFAITLDRPSSVPVSVDFVTGDEEAERGVDYHGRRGTVTIPAGATTATVAITSILDSLFEADERLRLELSNPVNATLDRHIHTGTIVNTLLPGRCANEVFGQGRTDVLTGSSAGDNFHAGTDIDILFGLAGDDCIHGERGDDQISGGDGNDLLDGDSGDDRLKGDGGNDRIVGGRGYNRYSGGDGADTIYARNGRAETVECGPGRDWVKADRKDRLRRCERVLLSGA
jgi:Ca2+-binding RTX toxin-like protein